MRHVFGRAAWMLAGGACAASLAFGWAKAADLADNLTVTDHMLTTDAFGGLVVIGGVRNATDRAYPNVRLRIELLDSKGALLGATGMTAEIAAGETWRFTAPAPAEGAARVRVAATSADEALPGVLALCPYALCRW